MANLESVMWYILLVEVIIILTSCSALELKKEKEKKKLKRLLAGKLDEWAITYEETGKLPSQTDSAVFLEFWAESSNLGREL